MPSSFVSSLSFPFSTHPLHPLVHCFPLQETLLSLLFDFLLVSWLLSIALQLHCFCIFSPSIYCFLVRLEQIVFSSSWWSVGAWVLLQRISLWSDQNPEMETFLWSIIRNRIDLEMNIPRICVLRIKIKLYYSKNEINLKRWVLLFFFYKAKRKNLLAKMMKNVLQRKKLLKIICWYFFSRHCFSFYSIIPFTCPGMVASLRSSSLKLTHTVEVKLPMPPSSPSQSSSSVKLEHSDNCLLRPDK